ncbi:MAG TPA: SAM-dependent methyltransferase [Thermoanaerobaculia bacterium]|jgi:SAM-dependent MidA family methyltransferase
MPRESSMEDVLRNLLYYGDLSFRDFVELVLYHPEFGYYATGLNPVGKRGDYITGPSLSPAFSFALSRLVREFVSRCGGGVCSIVDIGCGDGGLIRSLATDVAEEGVRFFGVDRALERVEGGSSGFLGVPRRSSDEIDRKPRNSEEPEEPEEPRGTVRFVRTIDEVPNDVPALLLSNELFDALPFTRLVKRGEHLHELWVRERDGGFDWSEHEAAPLYDDYFAERGIELAEGQFADLSLEWGALYDDIVARFPRALVVTFDYGYPGEKLFHGRVRRFGTAAAYAGQRVSRDLLADPGRQDLTAHINFSDLERAGERRGARTLFFERMAKFLLAIGITEHPLFRPFEELIDEVPISGTEEGLQLLEERENAKRLILPDGMGHDLRVLVQGRGISFENWSFQRSLF